MGMRILIISNLYPPHVLGGYEILCHQVVSYLQERGHQIHVLTSDHGQAPSEETITRTLKVYQGFDKSASFMRMARYRCAAHNYRQTQNYLKTHDFDVVFVWSLLRLTPASAHAVQKQRLPMVYTFNDENISSFCAHSFSWNIKGAVHWFLDRFVMPKITLEGLDFTYTTSISKLLKRNLLAKKVPVASSRVIYQGIPVEKFPLKEHAGTLHSPIRVLYAGQLHHYKGVHTIFKALGRLVGDASMPSLHLTVAGKGPEEYTQELMRLSKELKVDTSFIGSIAHEKMSGLYQEHDIFVFPSIWEEPFGLTHLEAMASGLPVVSTANGGQGEFLVNGQNSLVFEAEDDKGLADALQSLIKDEALRMNLTKEGRRVVTQSFSFERYVDELEALLAEACH